MKKETDAKTIYIQDTVPYKNSYMTLELYEAHDGRGLQINITYPEKEGNKHHTLKHIEVGNGDNHRR